MQDFYKPLFLFVCFFKAAPEVFLTQHRKDRNWTLARGSHCFFTCFPILILRSDVCERKRTTKEQTQVLSMVLLRPIIFSNSLQHSVTRLLKSIFHGQVNRPAAGRSITICLIKKVILWFLPSCPEILLEPFSSSVGAANPSSLVTPKWNMGWLRAAAAQSTSAHFSFSGHWQFFHVYLFSSCKTRVFGSGSE